MVLIWNSAFVWEFKNGQNDGDCCARNICWHLNYTNVDCLSEGDGPKNEWEYSKGSLPVW